MRIITFLLILFSSICRAQDVTGDVNKLINGQINTFSMGLDSIIVHTQLTSGTTAAFVDTLRLPINTTCLYSIHLQAENINTLETARAYKEIEIKNINGVYSFPGSTDVVAYPGQSATTSISKATWSILSSGGIYVIRVAGVAGVNMKWTITRTQIITAL